MSADIINNHAQSRYELEEDGHIAYAAYRVDGDILSIDYVFAPPELRGTGAAGRLMEGIMLSARHDNLKVYPVCGYAVSWLRRHPEYSSITPD